MTDLQARIAHLALANAVRDCGYHEELEIPAAAVARALATALASQGARIVVEPDPIDTARAKGAAAIAGIRALIATPMVQS